MDAYPSEFSAIFTPCVQGYVTRTRYLKQSIGQSVKAILMGTRLEACLSKAVAYLHKLRVFKGEDDIAILISITILILRITAEVLRACVRIACSCDFSARHR